MDDLIAALKIFRKYGNYERPIACLSDVLFVDIDPSKVSQEDIEDLEELGFYVDEGEDGFSSYRFGSC